MYEVTIRGRDGGISTILCDRATETDGKWKLEGATRFFGGTHADHRPGEAIPFETSMTLEFPRESVRSVIDLVHAGIVTAVTH